MNLNDNSTIPVTDEQVNTFYIWVKHTYGTCRVYQQACSEGPHAITEYFTLNILSPEMNSALDESDPYVGIVSDNPLIIRLQLYRRRIAIKISRTNTELIRRAFPTEVDNHGEDPEHDGLILWRHQNALFHEHLHEPQQQHGSHNIVKHQLATDVVNLNMIHDCGICLSRHKMKDTCVTNCGHQFGTNCLSNWTHITCPDCSDIYREVTVFIP